MNDILVLSNVTKRYGQFTAVDRLSLSIPAAQVYGFLGPNGAGKTTTLRMVMSIIYPDEGEISVLGRSSALQAKDRIGYLPEERGLYRKMTVDGLLRYFGRLKGMHGGALTQRIGDSLERVGLADWRLKRVEALSKGMQQKIQVVAALLHEPELVILDEPFSGLDPLNIDLLQKLILELRRAGSTIVLSTHQMESAQRMCDRLVLINRGRKLIEGTISEVRDRFASRTLLLDGEGDLEPIGRLAGIVDSHVTAGHARFELADGADPSEILRVAAQHIRVTRFEITRPDLQEIFVRLVNADGQSRGVADAAQPLAAPSRA
ncbi:MAG: ATP-binding cassette domain-containing protein [Phycisphaerae bacterium]